MKSIQNTHNTFVFMMLSFFILYIYSLADTFNLAPYSVLFSDIKTHD
ncbi:hypothetical protein [Morganella morganii IS15]|nr:hypothetical protein [Morganella morganii IS15]